MHNTVTHLCTVDSRTHVMQQCRFLGCVRESGVFSFLRCVPPESSSCLATMTTPASSRFSQDMVFARAVRKLPAELQLALEGSELLDPGQLRAFPRSPWGELVTAQRMAAVQASHFNFFAFFQNFYTVFYCFTLLLFSFTCFSFLYF